ncbi:bifunctional folylpolyglutamate synthase/dihydrofolate synthase [Neobacillus dielmonensis]|uniref:bifunctional folylpolyglutamate synthase/dihydrofolate synthase n=1 Tax=Neobacillus dielmonensis TaxID=1347369 RepID=UPI0005AB3034|nr:folylpolyglutamate synthase/dihydrofolate synthase family protein [Neobacillus dielmonensis]
MFTTYQEALNWIHARLKLGIKPGLKRMEWMMERLDNPQTKMKTVHIGGTNGKGSTVTFLRSILQAGGYSVGTFTSPYIEQFNERISVNGKPISDQEILDLTNIIRPLADELENTELGGPTEFEVITAMSFYFFAHIQQTDIVLYEVGLGGRFDSTNIINPLVSIITNIGLDHVKILGDTYEEIAFEKAGIIKPSTPIFTGAKHPGAFHVIKEQAMKQQAPLYHLGDDFMVTQHESKPRGEMFTLHWDGKMLEQLEISMIGQHQTENAALAVYAALYLQKTGWSNLTERTIREGLKTAFWPGRFEVLSQQPLIIIDGAHNNEGITALVNELTTRFPHQSIDIVFAALRDKPLNKMIARLDKIASHLAFVSFDYPRAAKAQELLEISQSPDKVAVEDWQSYLLEEIQQLPKERILVITGSLYFISQVKPFICKNLKNITTSL